MNYSLEFDPRALKEWKKLDSTIQEQLKKKLSSLLINPKIEANKLKNLKNCYKIKLKQSGYRLVYMIVEDRLVVLVIAIGKRERSSVYKIATKRVN